jgi:hypothetical protein
MPEPPVPSALQDAARHLELLGYRPEFDPTGVNFRREEGPIIRIYPAGDRLIFLVAFGIGANALADRNGFLDFLNRVNTETFLTKFYVNPSNRMFVQSHYAGPFDKARFGTFFDSFIQEMWGPRSWFPDDVKKFLT